MSKTLKWILQVDTAKGNASIRQTSKAAKDLTKDKKDLEQQTKRVGSSMSNLTRLMGGLVGALGVVKLYQATKAWEGLAGVQEKAEMGLEAIMKAQGLYTDAAFQQMKALASQTQAMTTFGDESVLAGQKILLTFDKINTQVLPEATRLTADLAAHMGVDYAMAARLMGQASEGMTSSMKRYGINIDESVFKTRGFEGVLQELEKRVGGAAVALRNTRTGELEAFGNTLGDIREKAGLVTLTMKSLVAKEIFGDIDALDRRLAEFLTTQEFQDWAESVAAVVTDVFRFMYSSVSGISDFIKAQLDALYGKATVQGRQEDLELVLLDKRTDLVKRLTMEQEKQAAIEARLAGRMGFLERETAEKELSRATAGAREYAQQLEAVDRQLSVVRETMARDAAEKPPEPPKAPDFFSTTDPRATGSEAGVTPAQQAAADAYIKMQEDVANRIAQLTLDETEFKILQLNRWKDAAVEIATAAGQDATAIEQAFALEMAELNQQTAAQEAAAWLEGEAAFAAHQQRLADLERTALEERANLQTELEGRLIELTEGRFEYQRHLLEQETADLLAKYETDKEMADLVAAYKIAKLDEIKKAEEANKMTSLEIAQTMTGGIANLYQEMTNASIETGQAGFEAYKALATAQALISTYTGAAGAYASASETPVIGWLLAPIAAAAAVAAGLKNVQAIQSAKPAKKHAEGGVFDTAHMGIIGEAGKEALLPLSEKYRQQGQDIFDKIAPIFLPEYAKGMLATSPHVGLVGEAGPEAIMPLDRGGMIPVDFVGNAAVVQLPNATVPLRIPAYAAGGLVGGRPAAAVSPSMSRNSSININLDLSGNTFVDQGAMDVFIENIATRVSHEVAREVAVDAVTQDYANDGPTRRMILGGYDG